MQPNISKYFLFPKIFSPKNILHQKNILHRNKHNLNDASNSSYGSFVDLIGQRNVSIFTRK